MIDLRTPIGLLFVILGVALVTYGVSSEPAIYDASLGINVNLWWGLVMGMFGVSMLAGAALARSGHGNGSAAGLESSVHEGSAPPTAP